MAAVDRVNTLYGQDSRGSQNSLLHSRDLSTISNVTLFTSTTLHSQPTEPLLHSTTPQSINYDDSLQLDSMPKNRDETIRRLPCEAPLMIDDSIMNAEKRNYRDRARNCRRPLERWKWLKLGLQACLCKLIPNLNFWHCRRSILVDPLMLFVARTAVAHLLIS